MLESRTADGIVILLRQLTERGVDEQLYLSGDQKIDSVRTPLVNLEDPFRGYTAGAKVSRSTFGADHAKAKPMKTPRDRDQVGLS